MHQTGVIKSKNVNRLHLCGNATVGRHPFLAGQNSKNSKLKDIKIVKVRVFSIVWCTFLREGASPAVRGNAVNA